MYPCNDAQLISNVHAHNNANGANSVSINYDFNMTIDPPITIYDDCNYLLAIDPDLFIDNLQIPYNYGYDRSLYNPVKEIRLKFATNVIISHINVNSVRNKFDEIRYMLGNGFLDIMCISETKLDSADSNNLFNVDKFTMFRQDKRKNSGGLMVFVNEKIACRQIDLHDAMINPDVEVLTIEISLDAHDKWLLCYIYKNPKVTDNDFESLFSVLFNKVACLYDNYVYIGDMNLNFLDPKSRIHDICSIHGLINLIKNPTCQKGVVGTIIDVILVPECDKHRFFNSSCEDIGISDFHSLVIAPMRKIMPAKKDEFCYYRKVKSINYDLVKYDLCNMELIQDPYNADHAFSMFHHSLCGIFEKHAPLLKRKAENKSFPIMNTELKGAILFRNRQRNKYYKTRSTSYYVLYKSARNKVTKIKRDLLRDYFSRNCKGGTSNKKFWTTIKPFLSHKLKSRNNIILRENENIVTDPPQLCNIFCDFFSHIGDDIVAEHENTDDPLFSTIYNYLNHPSITKIKAHCPFTNSFSLEKTNIPHVKKVIQNLDSKKAVGYDEIPSIFLKRVKNDISEALVTLFNRCIDECTFPQSLKMANISPIYKKKDRLNKDNYRSINLLPIISKIFERLIADQLDTYCQTIFHPILSGFRKKYGCSDILNKLLSDWKMSLDKKEKIGVVAIDLSKAFDCMPIGLLLAKLYAYGFSYDTCLFMKSYLCSRKQRVKIGSYYSEWATTCRGVPQGSILGPTLFNVFLNDLLYTRLNSSIYNYADDNTLSISGLNMNDIRVKLSIDLEIICDWFNQNMMRANPDKFQIMFLGASVNSVDYDLSFQDVTLKGEDSITILGVEFDYKLNFNIHTNSICKKVSQQINASMRININLDMHSRLAIYNSFIVSNFNYCNNIWLFSNKSGLSKLDKANERAIRFIYNDKKTPYDTLLNEKGHLDIFRLCYKGLCTTMYKIWNGISPPYLTSLFQINEHRYNLRDNQTYVLPNYQSKTHGYHSLSYIGAKAWTQLDPKVKKSPSIDSFKESLQAHVKKQNRLDIINHYF